jgi:predicted DNA-binding transcriptional regulator AlpA
MTLIPQLDKTVNPEATVPESAAVSTIADALRELTVTLPVLRAALERQRVGKSRVERLAYRLDEVADALGMSRRAIERERSAGRFPMADLHVGKAPLWRVETVRDWLDSRKAGSR